jgi:hypothetical protein
MRTSRASFPGSMRQRASSNRLRLELSSFQEAAEMELHMGHHGCMNHSEE